MITLFIQILGFVYILYCFVDTFISIRKDKKLIEELDYYKRENKDLSKYLNEVKIEKNIYRDLLDELFDHVKDIGFEDAELVEVEDE